jgi:hypothetical protein
MSLSASQYAGFGIIGISTLFTDPPDISHVFFSVFEDLNVANSLAIGERDSSTGALTDGPFSIAMICQ